MNSGLLVRRFMGSVFEVFGDSFEEDGFTFNSQRVGLSP